ncbi:MarR family transcriptional regulator [Sphingomonas sp. NSE70-1]|uniref:MarR family transcriptional regulator n=1 Tax=Sphingomonas caseinilyticus TaxID=2908205 RepID=A0ABT0RR16_9SPHN|nr:MarR family transcriptional regulator [Sphingomonas caseinilyticus]MCL6697268.1 MarR family transcriptional regulator [Sphingomonas caseinilyticus]
MKELAWELAETSRTLRRHFDRRASALGVTTAQWRALAWLGHEPGLKQVELAERLDVEPITAGRIVDRLEEAKLVLRQPDPVDRRVWRLFLTDEAKPIHMRLAALAEEMAEQVFDGLGNDEIEAMRAKLALIRENVGRVEAEQRKSA